jgi:uncharacterized protein YndB with AHSA1/START domain
MAAATAQDQDFTASLSVDQTPGEVFDAITNVRGWWSQNIQGSTDTVGAQFSYRYQDEHAATIRVTELVPGERVAWLVVDNYFAFTEDRNEWKGTQIRFDIAERAGKTEIRFTHQGLVPDCECFDVCSNSWDFYLQTSLRALIRTGQGLPNPMEPAASA